jgi:hypothetical protein
MKNYRLLARLDTSRDVDNRNPADMVGWKATVKLPRRAPEGWGPMIWPQPVEEARDA